MGLKVILDVVRNAAAKWPSRIGLAVDGGDQLTNELCQAPSNTFARSLRQSGIGRGDPVGMLFDNAAWPQFAMTYFGTLKAAETAVVPPMDSGGAELRDALARRDVAGVVWGSQPLVSCFAGCLGSQLDIGAANPMGPSPLDLAQAGIAQITHTSGTTGVPEFSATPPGRCTSAFSVSWRSPRLHPTVSLRGPGSRSSSDRSGGRSSALARWGSTTTSSASVGTPSQPPESRPGCERMFLVDLTVASFFDHSTIAGQAKLVESLRKESKGMEMFSIPRASFGGEEQP